MAPGQHCSRRYTSGVALGGMLPVHDSLTSSGGLMPQSQDAGLAPWEIGLWGLRPHLWYDPAQV